MEELERHYRFHLRRMALGLAFSLALGVAMIYALVSPGLQVGIVVAPGVVFIVASLGIDMAIRGRGWPRMDAAEKRVGKDEWVQANIQRSRRISLLSIYAAQVPLMFLVAYVPPEPTVATSVIGMAILTMVAGSAAFFGSYLLFVQGRSDG